MAMTDLGPPIAYIAAYLLSGGFEEYRSNAPSPIFLSPGDPSATVETLTLGLARDQNLLYFYNKGVPSSYGFNMTAFSRVARKFEGITDGSSQTIAFAEKYHEAYAPGQASLEYNNREWSRMYVGCSIAAYAAGIPPPTRNTTGRRRSSFADAGWDDVVPVTVNGVTHASVPGLTFQVRPKLLFAEQRLPQTPFSGGLPVGMFDGSVRTIHPGVAESAFWAAVTPASGDGGDLD